MFVLVWAVRTQAHLVQTLTFFLLWCRRGFCNKAKKKKSRITVFVCLIRAAQTVANLWARLFLRTALLCGHWNFSLSDFWSPFVSFVSSSQLCAVFFAQNYFIFWPIEIFISAMFSSVTLIFYINKLRCTPNPEGSWWHSENFTWWSTETRGKFQQLPLPFCHEKQFAWICRNWFVVRRSFVIFYFTKDCESSTNGLGLTMNPFSFLNTRKSNVTFAVLYSQFKACCNTVRTSVWTTFLQAERDILIHVFCLFVLVFSDEGVEDEFLCPITRELMREPVIASGTEQTETHTCTRTHTRAHTCTHTHAHTCTHTHTHTHTTLDVSVRCVYLPK